MQRGELCLVSWHTPITEPGLEACLLTAKTTFFSWTTPALSQLLCYGVHVSKHHFQIKNHTPDFFFIFLHFCTSFIQ